MLNAFFLPEKKTYARKTRERTSGRMEVRAKTNKTIANKRERRQTTIANKKIARGGACACVHVTETERRVGGESVCVCACDGDREKSATHFAVRCSPALQQRIVSTLRSEAFRAVRVATALKHLHSGALRAHPRRGRRATEGALVKSRQRPLVARERRRPRPRGVASAFAGAHARERCRSSVRVPFSLRAQPALLPWL
jgi:hypothetical protein